MELHLWRFKLKILQSWLPADISDLGFFFLMLLFLSEKKSKPVGYTRTLHLQTGKIQSELKLWFDVLTEKVCGLGSFDTVTSLRMGFCSKRAAAGLGPSGLSTVNLMKKREKRTKKERVRLPSSVLVHSTSQHITTWSMGGRA